ncbi:MAG: hypothetical protein J5895_02455 [Alphaproteobacteria bacterium]|nr:hypothetical protein [Alphaproteobacteria bacterium]
MKTFSLARFFNLLFLCLVFLSAHSVLADEIDRTVPQIQCGVTENGAAIMVARNECYQCKKTTRPALELLKKQLKKGNFAVLFGAPAAAPALLLKEIEYEYKQIPSNAVVPRNCQPAPNGGGLSEKQTKVLFIKLAEEAGQHCIVSNFTVKYAYCYGCEVVETLSSAFIKAAKKGYEVTKQAANAILIFAIIIWLCFFALKNVSSFTTVEPMQMLQELMVQCFKVIVAFVIINSGIHVILNYTLVPIMNTGLEFADTLVDTTAITVKPTISISRKSSDLGDGAGATGTGQGGVR